jgi:putative SOS response-associated peptidase YedK
VASVEPFAFAGIYSHWKDADTDEEIKTYSILTTAANKLMSKIHNTKMRMPVILPPGTYTVYFAAGNYLSGTGPNDNLSTAYFIPNVYWSDTFAKTY